MKPSEEQEPGLIRMVEKLKVRSNKTDFEEVVDTNRLVWNHPYELPCQSLYFALLHY